MSEPPVSEMRSSADSKDFKEFMSLMDIADIERRQDRAVQEQLSFEDQKKAIADRLRKTYATMGTEVTESQIDRAIESHYSKKWEFIPPKEGLGTTLALGYVKRNWIATRILVPIAALSLAVTGINYGAKSVTAANRRASERAVESSVEEVYRERVNLGSIIKSTSSSHYLEQLPAEEKSQFGEKITLAKMKIAEAKTFLEEFCPEGEADNFVTAENYEEVREKVKVMGTYLEQADSSVSYASELLDRQQKFTELNASLENLMFELKNSNPSQIFADRANSFYEEGKAGIRNRKIPLVEASERSLASVLRDSKDFSRINSEIEISYASVKRTAIEQKAVEIADELRSNAQKHAAAAEVEKMRDVVSNLQELQNVLNQEYTLRIVSRPGEKSGIDRFYNGSFSGWYIIMEAIDNKTGVAIPREILNCETGRRERVTAWGVRVPGERNIVEAIQRDKRNGIKYSESAPLVKRIIMDKLDNGIVDNNVAGYKKKGYITPQMEMEGFEDKFITRW